MGAVSHRRFPSPGSPEGSILFCFGQQESPSSVPVFQGAGAPGPVLAEHSTPLGPQGWTHRPGWASQGQLWPSLLDSSLGTAYLRMKLMLRRGKVGDGQSQKPPYCFWLQLVFPVTGPSKLPSFLPPFLPSSDSFCSLLGCFHQHTNMLLSSYLSERKFSFIISDSSPFFPPSLPLSIPPVLPFL